MAHQPHTPSKLQFLLAVAVIAWAASAVQARTVRTNKIPPPPPRVPSPPASPPSPCQQCFTYEFIPPPGIYDFPPYRYYDGDDSYICIQGASEYASRVLDDPFDELLAEGQVSGPMLVPFAQNVSCKPLLATFCGTFASRQDAEALLPFMQSAADVFTDAALNQFVCPRTSGGYAFRAYSSPDSCVQIQDKAKCGPAPDPFPRCNCDKTRGITPLYAQPKVTLQAGRSSRTDLYCFDIAEVPQEARVNKSNCASTLLSKAEIWADDANTRRNVTGIRVTPNGGSPSWLSPTWGSVGDNQLKATPLNWRMDQAIGGQICIELLKGASLDNLCMGSTCYIALFNEKRNCCPAFGSSLPMDTFTGEVA